MDRHTLGCLLVAAMFAAGSCSSDEGPGGTGGVSTAPTDATMADAAQPDADAGGTDTGSDAVHADAGSAPATGLVGPEGGTVTLPDGTTLTIPAGALDGEVTFTIQATGMTPTTFPGGLSPVTELVTVLPSGTVFHAPATLTLPYDSTGIPGDGAEVLTLYTAPSLVGPWVRLETGIGNGVLTAEISHLSEFQGASGCRTEGQGCNYAVTCCNTLACVGARCGACLKDGQAATDNNECCSGYTHIDGHCVSCVHLGGACDTVVDCCNGYETGCIGGTCSPCLPAGSACTRWDQCCGSLLCVDGVCAGECGELGATCTSGSDCCGNADKTTQCAGGVCAPCGQPGQACAPAGDCCAGQWCDDGQCQGCGEVGASCPYDHACCGGRCDDGRCVTCFSSARVCTVDADCCSGACVEHVCQACPNTQAACTTKADCCPGGCCEQEDNGLNCIDGACTKCHALGEPCGAFGGPCCGDLQCINGTCSECSEAGGPCQGLGHCCGDLVCWQGACETCHGAGQPCAVGIDCCDGNNCDTATETCFACVADGQACDDQHPCCSNECLNGVCQGCVDNGEPCASFAECCSGGCVSDVCVPCHSLGEPCDGLFEVCCGLFECKGGTCEWGCSLESAPCGPGQKDCCPWLGCFGAFCKTCGDEGDPCGDGLQCCDDWECVGGVCEPPCAHDGQSCANEPCCGPGSCDADTKICGASTSTGGPCVPPEAAFDGNPQFGQAHVEYDPSACTCAAGSGYSGDPNSIAVDFFGTPMGGTSPEPPWTIEKTEPDIGSGPWLESVPKNTPLTLWLTNPVTGQKVRISFIYTNDGIVQVAIGC